MYTGDKINMAKLSKREYKEMKRRAIGEIRHLVLGYDIGHMIDEESGCIKLCKGYEQIEVADVPQVPFPTFGGKRVVIKARIVVRGNGIECVTICPRDAEFLKNKIKTLKEFVDMIEDSVFDKEKITEAYLEAYFAVQDIQMYLNKLLPFTQS
jgi:hypothetical protein